jgi:mRNA interferase HicA
MPKSPVLRSGDFLKRLERYGCVVVSVRGSHHKVRNPETGKTSVVPMHGGTDLKKALLAVILTQLGIDADEFWENVK